jgi:hypothetical protein
MRRAWVSLDDPWWTYSDRAISAIDPMTGEAAPVLEPPPGSPDAGGTVTQLTNNLTNNYNTIIQVPSDIVKGVQQFGQGLNTFMLDPNQPPTSPSPFPAPEATAWVPTPDPPVTYTGTTPQPSWENVFEYYSQTTHAQTPDLPVPSPVTGLQVQRAIDVAQGQTIKALSGFINQAVDLQTLSSQELANRITDVENIVAALNNNQGVINQQQHAILDLLVNGAIPELWAEIHKTQQQIINEANGVLKLMQQWSLDHIFKPLEEQLGQEKTNRIAQVDSVITSLPGTIVSRVEAMGLATAAGLAGVAAQVATLAQESTDCTVPMCETMGPKTDLGKLLKALSLAGDVALLAEIANINESDLASLISTVASKAATYIDFFENTFMTGGQSIGSTVAQAVTSAL